MSRLAKKIPAQKTATYRSYVKWLTTGSWERREGPFRAYLMHPALGHCVNSINQILRNEGTIPLRVREIVILTNSIHWQTPFEWFAHEKMALDAGLDPKALARLCAGKPPRFKKADENATYEVCREFLETRFVRAATFERARKLIGDKGLLEVITTLGFYTTLSFIINGYEIAMPKGAKTPIKLRAKRTR
ncbi:MAG: hypothetical protein EXQ90_07360 [Rhodospirillales bacterium]|nr:hypothetical protein [Rhodospirillales bacterium]